MRIGKIYGIVCDGTEFSVRTKHFVFIWSNYAPDQCTLTYWLGVALYWRWPWDKSKEGSSVHGFRIISDELYREYY